MITIEYTEVFGLEAAVRGMRNPMNSWDKSDSYEDYIAVINDGAVIFSNIQDAYGCVVNSNDPDAEVVTCFNIGEKDLMLMKQLVKAGTDHSKFMRMINVTCDITAPLYWWKEFDTYKVGTVRNSCSTMQKIQEKKFTLENFSHEHLLTCEDFRSAPDHAEQVSKDVLEDVIKSLNYAREYYLETNDKCFWWQMIQLLPSSYNQRATVQMNYAVLRNMYHSRKNHKLDEWHTFCNWIKTLPYSELITE